jgi:hypothetical protein
MLQRIEEGVKAASAGSSEFRRVGKNSEMEKEYWISLLDDLKTTTTPVYFLGKRLTNWREQRPYARLLRNALICRIRGAIQNAAERYETYILFADSSVESKWKDFLREVAKEVSENAICSERIKLLKVDEKTFYYSAVLCGKRLSVTPYTSDGVIEDSPTLDIRTGTDTWDLYECDLKSLVRKNNSSGCCEWSDNGDTSP